MFESFIRAFIPLFVAMDTLGLIPLFLGLTRGIEGRDLRRLIYSATFTAFIISILFLFAGSAVFSFMGITADDFRIGGGVLLLVLAIQDLASTGGAEQGRAPHRSVGVVPIGIPLIMGPAALTTILIIVESHGVPVTLAALLANFALVLLMLLNARWIIRVMGEAGAEAFAKVASLFMAGIAVMMIRSGILGLLK
jgi:multiple antibiotic resistance protein